MKKVFMIIILLLLSGAAFTSGCTQRCGNFCAAYGNNRDSFNACMSGCLYGCGSGGGSPVPVNHY